jgi:diacylglycerol kinase family enzyme
MVTVIYNPRAGRGKAIAQAVEVLERWAGKVEVLETRGRGSATELARASKADLVLACGGDGTVNEVINGVATTNTVVGVLPAGTANVLAEFLGVPIDPVRAAKKVPEMTPRRVALGKVRCQGGEERYFVLMCGAGLDAELMAGAEAFGKKRWGMLAYWMAGLRLLGRRWETLQVEGRDCTVALACRVHRIGGGLRVTQGSHLHDDDLEVVLFPSRSAWRYVGYVAESVVGRTQPAVLTRRVEMTGEGRVQADGEVVGRLPAVVEVVPDAVTLLGTW